MNPSAVVPFRFESHEVRALTINGEPWFVARDICDALGLDHITNALSKVPEQHLTVIRLQSGGQDREMKAVSEPGLYRLVLRCDKPQAEPFMEWVTAEVLPSIRKTGGYSLPEAGKRADIFHHRRPLSKTGLDIRFTCDLTKVLTKRHPGDLAVLQRLTGIELMDLASEDDDSLGHRSRGELMALLDLFAASHLVRVPGATVTFKELYQRFLVWYGQQGLDISYVPSLKAVASWLDVQGLPRRKPSGVATVYGCILVGEVAA